MIVKEIMSCPAITFMITDTVFDVLKIMNEKNINGAPIVNKENELVGMIVKADIYRFLIDPGHYGSCPIEWVMSKNVVTAQRDEHILSIAKRLRENNIVAMPVIENHKVIGIISFEDIIDYFIKKQSSQI
ncbi:CBS domain-containing protein [Inediibacterium massiliense]|uniref:CBS domain-containing protein n=1 Tax=Inediibacterium massiliense TaxID=1658111 RepID=UPI0006B480B5|nr:CBS domain-containing protein [Inediibacterium massiliense]